MSVDENPDDRDLTAAFRELHAPRSTAAYRQRAPRPEVVRPSGSWMRAAGAALAVAVALGGAAAFLGLRNARQNGAATAVAAPPARSGAAMAFDSTLGKTIMYGGFDAAGRPLGDTWAWDGTAWQRWAATGEPGGLTGVRMSDDPADGGVLLVGTVAPPASSGGVTGCAVSGSGTATGTATTTAPSPASSPAATGSSAGGAPGFAGGTPATSPPPAPRPPSSASLPPCQALPAPVLQTWILSAHGWTHAAPGSATDTPGPGAQVAFDGATGQVVAVTSWYAPLGCGPPQLMCPLAEAPGGLGASSGAGAASAPSALPCRETAGGGCAYPGLTLQTWTWSHGRWTARPAPSGSSQPTPAGGAALLSDGNGSAMLLAATWATCPPENVCATPAQKPALEEWTWSGAAWTRTKTVTGAFELTPTSVAQVGREVLAVASDGSTRVLDIASGRIVDAGSVGPRVGEAVAEGPAGTAVLFGGSPVMAVAAAGGGPLVPYATGPASGLGADTWRWDGHAWTHVSGALPSAPPLLSPCPADATQGCPVPAPSQGGVAPQPAPAGTPGSAPGGTPTTVTAPASPSPT